MSADPVTVSNPAGIVYAAFSLLSPGQSRRERKEKRAAERAGYDVRAGGKGISVFTDPAGNRITRGQFYAAGRAIRAANQPIDNTPKRRRTPGGPGYRPPSWQVSPLPGPWIPPETDSDFEQFERDTNAQWRGFVGPVPTIPDTMPRTLPRTLPQTTAGTIARVLARAVALPWLIFYPSRTADDDTLPGPMPQPIPPRGPSRRPRVRTVPRAPTVPGPYRPPQPRFPSDFEREPGDLPDRVSDPAPGTRPAPSPAPSPAPVPRPRSPTRPAPAPTPTPTGLPFWVPLLPQLLPRVPSRFPNRPLRAPLTPNQPARVEYPLQNPFALPLQARPSNCPPCERTRKRRKRTCVNRITNKRTFTRGGSKFRTITRKLEC